MFNCKKLGRPNTKRWVGQKTLRANELGGPNTKLGRPVPSRPTRSAATGAIVTSVNYEA